MRLLKWNAAACAAAVWLASAPLARAAPAPPTAVPAVAARQAPPTWHYTTNRPAAGWERAGFDDASWKTGTGAFGSEGTPGINVKTAWTTRDIWLRRNVTLPAGPADVSALQINVFHDEDVEIYFDGTLAARQRGFVTDYQPIDISAEARRLLKPGGTIVVAVHCRQTGGGQGIDVTLGVATPEQIAERRRNRYRSAAMSSPGSAAAGRKLFEDAGRLGCVRCHTTDGSSGRAGPDLLTVGDKFPRSELINALLMPSAQIAIGYGTTVVTTKDGNAFVGIVKEAGDDHVGLMEAGAKVHRIATKDIKSRRTARESLMPDGLEAGLSREEFTDLVEYLVSLRLPAVADAGRQGMPVDISELRPAVALVPIHSAASRFEHPCWFGQIPGSPGDFLVCEHETGRVWRLLTADGRESKTLWGDFRKEVRPGGATGLLGLAFHPRFRENRKYYVQHQIVVDGRIYARVSEKIASDDLTRDSGRASRTIMEFICSTDVHSGGGIAFGPDGMLYIGMGDTGPQGDPEGHAQNLRSLLGKMLRIDVDHETAPNAYAVPADNPLASRPDARGEIWAYGFREPWRFSFDPLTNDLWVGDVGQDRIEEVDLVRRGENYGWNVYEGFDLFSTRYRTDGAACVPPVFAYNRRLGNSVTGGYVYRGDERSPFYGTYVCGDFTSRRVWGLKQTDRKLTEIRQLCTSPQEIASFGRDENGALYVVGYEGTIFRLDLGAAVAAPGPTANSGAARGG